MESMAEVKVTTAFPEGMNEDEARHPVGGVLHREAKWADAKYAYYERVCRRCEEVYELASGEFIARFESGELGDDQDYFDWYAAQRGREIWKHCKHP
jgi:hypothetical protein